METNSLVDVVSEPCQSLSGALLLMLSAFRRPQQRSMVPLSGLPGHFPQARLLFRDSLIVGKNMCSD